MSQMDENAYIECLPTNIYKDLVNALNEDAGWITLANHVAEQLQYQRTAWIQYLKNIKEPYDSPGQRLLFELNIKMCTIEILRMLLYDCGLHNALSIISHPEPLQIILHPTEQLQSDTLKISFGHNLKLLCKATGMPPPSYMWYHENIPLQHCNSETLDIVITSISQVGEYKCKVSQTKHDGTLISTLISKIINVQIFPTPVTIDEQPQPILEIKEGKPFTIYCKASGNPDPQYQWFHGNTKLEGETSNRLHIKKFNSKHEGKYYCYVYNDISEVYTQRTHVMMCLPKLKAVAKIALIIANENYNNHEDLFTPKNDGAYIAELLKEIGFEVICLIDLTITQIRNAVEVFSKALVEGVYGLFYFAGHGFKMQESYILPTDVPKKYLRTDAICESELLASFLQNDPELLITILDMCQTPPPKNSNSEIYNELPVVFEYKSKKNLRNLIQAYSTSSHRPSYEKLNSQYGLYITHLCKYITKDIQVTKLFEEVGKSFENGFKGKKLNQIPIFASTITKPFHLTDAIVKRSLPAAVCYFNKLTSYTAETFDITFQQANIHTKVTISLMEPYSNIIKIKLPNLEHLKVNFFNSVHAKQNILYRNQNANECYIYNPQFYKGKLVISVSEQQDAPITATLLDIKNYTSPLLKHING